ncbi:MAG: fused MFS/spermidine synthase, partial [Bryobacteraceae bacterium]
MTRKEVPQPNPQTEKYLPLLLLLFAGSGCSALIYEIVWYQLLQLVIGSTAISLGVLLATFMGGLFLGSMLYPNFGPTKSQHPLRVYALIELGVGILGIVVLFGMPLLDRVYVAGVGHGLPSILLRALLAAICLMPPTILMGASLPALSRWIEASPRGVSWMGLLYGSNTVGAVFGCLLAGFSLLRAFDMATATYVAVAINAAVGLIGLWLAGRSDAKPAEPAGARSPAIPAKYAWTIYAAIALSGASALGAEVVWTRLLGLLLGATVYTFSIILAVFLIGLGIGSGAGALLSQRLNSRAALGYCQLFLVASIAWTAFMIAKSLPFWPVNPLLSSNPWFTFQIDLVRVLWT